ALRAAPPRVGRDRIQRRRHGQGLLRERGADPRPVPCGPMSRPVALVTGAARGIGRSTALALAGQGHDVVVNFSRSRSAAESVAAEAELLGARVLLAQADVADEAAVRA